MENNTDIVCIYRNDQKVPMCFIRKSAVEMITVGSPFAPDHSNVCTIYINGVGHPIGMDADTLARKVFGDDTIDKIKTHLQHEENNNG